jgi:Na+-driven multidrug efflux pump
VGQNHGAKQYKRIDEALRKSMSFIFVWQLIIYLVLALAAEPMSRLFSDELEVQKIIQLFIYIVPISYIGLGFCLVITATINALHKTRFSLQINILRLFILYLPFAWLGKELGGLQGLFIGCAIGNTLIGLAILLFFRHVRHSKTWQRKLLSSDS